MFASKTNLEDVVHVVSKVTDGVVVPPHAVIYKTLPRTTESLNLTRKNTLSIFNDVRWKKHFQLFMVSKRKTTHNRVGISVFGMEGAEFFSNENNFLNP